MSATPTLEPQQLLPPPLPTFQQAHKSHSGHGSFGSVFGVLAVITILAALAVMVGWLCSSRRIMGHGQYDLESWVEIKCAKCIDGRVDPPPPRVVVPLPESSQEEETSGEWNKPHERAQA